MRTLFCKNRSHFSHVNQMGERISLAVSLFFKVSRQIRCQNEGLGELYGMVKSDFEYDSARRPRARRKAKKSRFWDRPPGAWVSPRVKLTVQGEGEGLGLPGDIRHGRLGTTVRSTQRLPSPHQRLLCARGGRAAAPPGGSGPPRGTGPTQGGGGGTYLAHIQRAAS